MSSALLGDAFELWFLASVRQTPTARARRGAGRPAAEASSGRVEPPARRLTWRTLATTAADRDRRRLIRPVGRTPEPPGGFAPAEA